MARAKTPLVLLSRLQRRSHGFVDEFHDTVSQGDTALGPQVVGIFFADDGVVRESAAEYGVNDSLGRVVTDYGTSVYAPRSSYGGNALVTGLLSPFVNVSFLTSLLKTEAVSVHARLTAAMATCFSASYV